MKFISPKILLGLSITILTAGILITISLITKPQTLTPKADYIIAPTGAINKACAIKTCQGNNLLQCLPKTVYVEQGEPCPEYDQCERNGCTTPPTPTLDPANPNPTSASPQPTVAAPSNCPPGTKACAGVYVCRSLCGCNYSQPQCVPQTSVCPENECSGPNDDAACAGCVCTPWEYSGNVGEGGCGENSRPMTRSCTENGQPSNCSATQRCDTVHEPFPTTGHTPLSPTPATSPSEPIGEILPSPTGISPTVTPTVTPPICPLPSEIDDLIITCPQCQ